MLDPIVLMWARRLSIGIVHMPLIDSAGHLVQWLGQDFVIIDIDGTPAEQRCTAMHELGHHYLRHPLPESDEHYEALETQANRWAGEQLIPDDLLADALRTGRDLREVAEILCVDPGTLDARMGFVAHRIPALSLVSTRVV